MINIFTEELLPQNRFKTAVKVLMGRSVRGPQGVVQSLVKGFHVLGEPYAINRSPVEHVNVACVLNGAGALRRVLEWEDKGLVKKIVAGPNIVVMPYDENKLLHDDRIDRLVVPSEWVKQKYLILAPKISHKLRIWAAGVNVPQLSGKKKDNDFLVYNKIGNHPLTGNICRHLEHLGFTVTQLAYGTFKQRDYFELLERSQYMVYLSETESQGLGMFEAWARGVPTLVWERGFFERDGFRLEGNTASPYLSDRSGARFGDFEEFQEALSRFLQSDFKPREYVLENFTYEKSARQYLEIINS